MPCHGLYDSTSSVFWLTPSCHANRGDTSSVRDIPPALVVRRYSDDLTEDFYRIDAERVEAMFALDDDDIQILSRPRELVIDCAREMGKQRLHL